MLDDDEPVFVLELDDSGRVPEELGGDTPEDPELLGAGSVDEDDT